MMAQQYEYLKVSSLSLRSSRTSPGKLKLFDVIFAENVVRPKAPDERILQLKQEKMGIV